MCPNGALVTALAPPWLEGEAGTPVTVVSSPGRRAARRAGLEFVEKLLTAMIWVVLRWLV